MAASDQELPPASTSTPNILPPPDANPTPPGGSLGSGGSGGGQASSINSFQNEPTATPSHDPVLPPPSFPSSSAPSPAPSVITFNNTANFGTAITGRVFRAENQTKTLSWAYDPSKTRLIDIFWYGQDNNGSNVFNTSQAKVIASGGFNGSKSSEFVTVNLDHAVLNLTAPNVTDWYEKEMVLKIEWVTQDDEAGYSQTGVFTIAPSSDINFDAVGFTKNATASETDKFGAQVITRPANPPDTPPSSGGFSGNIGGGGHGGLSTGAKVGIAVSCSIVGLALIGALVWFFLRRRRRHFDEGYKATRQTTSSFIASKEARPSVAESPIVSPFSDDGEARGFSTSGVAIAMPVPLETTATRGSTTGPASTRGESRADRPDTSASGNRSRNISHLVEEGMTEADILQLEEEERHLDAEIERAGRRTSA